MSTSGLSILYVSSCFVPVVVYELEGYTDPSPSDEYLSLKFSMKFRAQFSGFAYSRDDTIPLRPFCKISARN